MEIMSEMAMIIKVSKNAITVLIMIDLLDFQSEFFYLYMIKARAPDYQTYRRNSITIK